MTSYEMKCILEMNHQDAFDHLMKFGQEVLIHEVNGAKTYFIRYLHFHWTVLVKGDRVVNIKVKKPGECYDHN